MGLKPLWAQAIWGSSQMATAPRAPLGTNATQAAYLLGRDKPTPRFPATANDGPAHHTQFCRAVGRRWHGEPTPTFPADIVLAAIPPFLTFARGNFLVGFLNLKVLLCINGPMGCISAALRFNPALPGTFPQPNSASRGRGTGGNEREKWVLLLLPPNTTLPSASVLTSCLPPSYNSVFTLRLKQTESETHIAIPVSVTVAIYFSSFLNYRAANRRFMSGKDLPNIESIESISFSRFSISFRS